LADDTWISDRRALVCLQWRHCEAASVVSAETQETFMHTHTTLTLVAPDGFELGARRYDPPAGVRPRALLVLAPAMGVRQAFYASLASWLGQRGSRRGTLSGFRADLFDWATKDCAAVLDHARSIDPSLPIGWVGHSVGAQLLGLVPNRHLVSAALSVAAGSGYWRFNARPLRYYVLALWFLVPFVTRAVGYFPGKKLRTVGDLPSGVANQWRKWCLDVDYMGVEGEALRAQLAGVDIPITALSIQDDELMTLRGTKALFGLYRGAQVEVRRVRPADHGLARVGHFGFFRPGMETTLWPMLTEWASALSPASARLDPPAQGLEGVAVQG
jgi:predicted alpha/beta hydrolase